MKKQPKTPFLQNLTLVLLSVLLVFLAFFTWIDDLSLEQLPADSYWGQIYLEWSYGSGYFELRSDEVPATYPMTMAVTVQGSTLGTQNNQTSMMALYQAVSQHLTNAFDAVANFTPSTTDAYTDALAENGIFVNYEANLPFSLICAWLDSTSEQTMMVRSLWLTAQGDLWVRDGSGALWVAQSVALPTAWADAIAALSLESCTFAGDSYDSAPDTLLFEPETTNYAVITTTPLSVLETPTDPTVQNVLLSFDYDAYVSSYSETATNTEVFVENNSTLRISNQGVVRFRASSIEGGLESYGDNEVVQAQVLSVQSSYARQLLENTLRTLDTEGEVRLQSVEIDAQAGTTSFVFVYMVNNIVVSDQFSTAAQFVFQGQALIAADINLCSFVATEQTTTVLPMAQTLALTENQQEICLSYQLIDDFLFPVRSFVEY